MAWHWYDFVYSPWTIGKYAWEVFKRATQKPQEPGRPPQVSAHGGAIPIVFGQTRITGSFIYFTIGLVDDPVFGKLPAIAAALALCEGPIAGVGRMWRDKTVRASPGAEGWAIFSGTRPTAATWTDPPAAKQLDYPGTAFLAAYATRQVDVNAWPGFGQISFEVQGLLHATGDAVKGDADPSQIVDVLVRDRVGAGSRYYVGVGVPFDVRVSTGRDGLAASSYARYVDQLDLWLSPALTDRRPAAEHLKDVLEASNSTCLWTGGLLEIVPLGDTASGTFTPYVTAQYALTPDDLVDGRVEMELGAVSDVRNVCPVEYLDREPVAAATDTGHAYNVAIESDPEPVDSASRGELRADAVAMHAICQRPIALTISRARAQQMVRVRNRYRFRLPWRFARLEPLDFVTMTDSRLGLSGVAMRIEEISEDDEHTLDVTAIEWPFGVGHAVAHTTSSSDGPLAEMVTPLSASQQAQQLALLNLAPVTVPAGRYFAVEWNGSLFCAVGRDIADTVGLCATSPDGVTWTTRTMPAGAWADLVWNGSLFCAVGRQNGNTNSAVCATSPDGVTWTTRTMPAPAAGYDGPSGIAWSGTAFCATGRGNGVFPYIATSPTGVTWTARSAGISGTSTVSDRPVWSGSRFHVACTGGVLSSTDGAVWSLFANESGTSIDRIAVNEVVLIKCSTHSGTGDHLIYTSTDDGVTWVQQTPAVVPHTLGYLAWTGELFVGFSNGGSDVAATVYTSPDGQKWSRASQGLPHLAYYDAAWSGSRVVAVPAATSVLDLSLAW